MPQTCDYIFSCGITYLYFRQSAEANVYSATPSTIQRRVNDVVPFSCLTCLDDTPIGTGAFGDVYKMFQNEWACHVAYKKLDIRVFRKDSERDQKFAVFNKFSYQSCFVSIIIII